MGGDLSSGERSRQVTGRGAGKLSERGSHLAQVVGIAAAQLWKQPLVRVKAPDTMFQVPYSQAGIAHLYRGDGASGGKQPG